MKISIIVTFKKEVLDPQGTVIQRTLKNMGFEGIKNIRQGKYFDIELDEKKIKSYQKAKKPLLIGEVDKIGTTSITLRMEARKHNVYTGNQKVRFGGDVQNNGTTTMGGSNYHTGTHITFMRLGDT